MSTEIKTIATALGDMTLTQFNGGQRGLCIQVTQPAPADSLHGFHGFIQLTRAEALDLATNLMQWALPRNKTAPRQEVKPA